MHHVRESDNVEKLIEQTGIVDITLNDEHAVTVNERLACLFQRRVVVIIEIVQSDDAVSTSFERQRNMGPDETGSAGDEYRDAAGAVDLGGGTDLFLPLEAAPGGGEIAGAGIDKALEAEIGDGESD